MSPGQPYLVRRPAAGGGPRGLRREVVTAAGGDDAATALLDALEATLPAAGWLLCCEGGRGELTAAEILAGVAGASVVATGSRLVVGGELAALRPLLESAGGLRRPVLLVRDLTVAHLLEAGHDEAAITAAGLSLRLRPGAREALLEHDPSRSHLVAAGGPEIAVPAPSAGGRPLLAALLAATVAAALLLGVGVRALRGSGPAAPPAPAPSAGPQPVPPGLVLHPAAGPAPGLRQQPAAAEIAGITLLEGGVLTPGNSRDPSPPPVDSAETWTWQAGRWQAWPVAGAPPARHGGLLAPDRSPAPPSQASRAPRFVLVGGYSGITPLTDTWRWSAGAWTVLPRATAPGRPLLLASDSARSTDVLVVQGPDGARDTAVLQDDAWTPLHTPTPPLRELVDTGDGVVGLAVPVGELAAVASTWRWSGAAWLPLTTAGGPEVDVLTAQAVAAGAGGPGSVLLVEVDLTGAAAPGGTWLLVLPGAWRHLDGPIPVIVRSFDAATPVWGAEGDRRVLIGGLAGDPGYVRAAVFDGTHWQDDTGAAA